MGKPPPRWRERHARAPINIPANATLFGDMDILGYTYDAGNKLVKVTDIGNATYGFKDGANLTTEYLYDANGNLKTDANKNITAIQYNYLNLPTQVTINGQNILYVYDATGVKLRKTVNTTTTDYTGNFIYENNVLQFFNQPEGYVEISSPPSGELEGAYVYQYKDHLGNIRLSYKDISLTSTPSLQIVEENNYYPFGLKHKGYNNLQNGRDHNFGFGNKEEQEELGLSWIDITARNYDPALGRWMNVDPLAEQMRRHSPYNYAFNNPIYFIDPDGMAPAGFGGIVQFSKTPESDDFDIKQTDNKLIRELLAENRIIAGNFSQGSSGPGDPPKIFNSKTETAVGEDVVNQLDEVVVNGKSRDASGQGINYNDQYAGAVEKLAGKPYLLRANGPDAYDCSSTACYGIRTVANSKFGDYTAHDLYTMFSVPSSSKTRGSVIFYDYTSDGRIDHITTILNSSNMLHPSSGAGVLQIKPINYLDSYTNNRGGTIYYREFNWLIINKTP